MATDARAYYDIDTQGFDPNTEQTRAFNQATQRMSNTERQQLSDFFAGQARKEQAKLPQNTRAPSGAKAPAQKARAPMQQGEMAAVENWLRTPEAQTFLVGQGEMAMTGGGAPASPPQDTDRFMGENQRDQQMMQQQSQREALINYLMGMQQQNQYRPPMRRPQMMPNQMPYDPGLGVVG